MSTRRAAIARAQAERQYERLADLRVVRSVNRRRGVTYADARGEIGTVSLDWLGAGERMRLFTETDDGPEPMWLWLSESGLPMDYRSWEACFGRANERCARLDVPIRCHPHMLRHSFALRMLVTLQHVVRPQARAHRA